MYCYWFIVRWIIVPRALIHFLLSVLLAAAYLLRHVHRNWWNNNNLAFVMRCDIQVSLEVIYFYRQHNCIDYAWFRFLFYVFIGLMYWLWKLGVILVKVCIFNVTRSANSAIIVLNAGPGNYLGRASKSFSYFYDFCLPVVLFTVCFVYCFIL